ncbi:iron-sulfur cluster co-chaperone protein HscB homolog [Coffea arabica]|uniref:Iron-sulfur cluster co-chaperone protein HscB homolog n=1 Tax=Coffea arabica TaxID=13443 RepID=A0ABM4UMQ5_COFAR|nr:iron-sulfur cluster co-chaperone protein HscB, mitochondrial-like [Coffea arabica]
MWKKLHSLTPLSTNLLHRGSASVPYPSATTADPFSSEITSKRSSLSQFSSLLLSPPQFQIEGNYCYSFHSPPSSRVFQTPRLHSGLHGLNSGFFCSIASSPAANSKCWNCNAVASSAVPFLVCHGCRSVQPPDPSIDYFQILGVEKKYDVKVENLEGKYKDWQKKLHPDLVHTKSKKERDFAAEQSARVTDAYRTLSDTLSRAVYLLKLEGLEVDEEGRISDPELLAEIMEIREAVEEAAETQALNHIQAQIWKKLEHWSKSFADAFQSRKYEEAISSIQRMTYYKRANEEIIKKL